MKKHCLALIFIGFYHLTQAIDFSRVNVAWQYDANAELKMAHRVIKSGQEVYVFLKVSTDSVQRWDYQFLLQNGYESEAHKVIVPASMDTLRNSEKEVTLKIGLAVPTNDLLVVNAAREEQSYYYDIELRVGNISFPSVFPIEKSGVPITRNYINRSGHHWVGSDSLFIQQYAEEFPRADPPMGEMKPITPTARQIASFGISNDSIVFEEEHFYVVMSDANASSGVTMLRVPPYFPEYRRLRELVASMLYLTSEAEEKALLKSKDLKKDFDSFWINNLDTKSRARSAIRKYYKSVEQANELFTDFKPGWKTDRGMMYIVYGKPDEVYRQNGLEEWYYDSGEAFEFNVISTFFAPRTYSLRRNIAFEEEWFQKIAQIRSGVNE